MTSAPPEVLAPAAGTSTRRPGPRARRQPRGGGHEAVGVADVELLVALEGHLSYPPYAFTRLLATWRSLPRDERPQATRHQRPQPQRAKERLSPEVTAQLVADYQSGASMKELAARWQLHRTTVAAHLRRAGVVLRREGVPDDRLAKAVRLYGEGWSCQRLSERYACDAETVRQALKRAGTQLRAPWERPPGHSR